MISHAACSQIVQLSKMSGLLKTTAMLHIGPKATYQTTSTLPLDFKRDWAITDFAAIIPLAINIVDHALCPLVLNPSLMIFNY